MSKIKQAYIHIGMPKTGSTSIQNFLSSNRNVLEQRGFAYLKSLGDPNQRKLSLYTQDRLTQRRVRSKLYSKKLGIEKGTDIESFRNDVLRDMLYEIDKLHSCIGTLIFSCEMLTRTRFDYIERLKSLLDKVTEDSRVVLYLRDQVGYIESSYSTALRGQSIDSLEVHAFKRRNADYLQYHKLIDAWSRVFGANNMIVRIFEPSDLYNGDIVLDFAQSVSLPIDDISLGSRPLNRSLDKRFQKSMMLMNENLPSRITIAEATSMNVLFGIIGKEDYFGEPYKLNRELYQETADSFAETNEIVRQRWFPDRERLFTDTSNLRRSQAEPDGQDYVERALAQDLLQNLLKRELRAFQGGKVKRLAR